MKNAIAYSIALLLFGSCAQVVAPNGGEKDTTPPSIVSCSPPNLSANFSGSRIEIQFDEYVQLNNLTQQLIISPPLNEKPDIYLKKKSVVIDFNGELDPNTTYTINFGNAIADITENNINENLTYTFSTGLNLDSLGLSGEVVNAFSKLPEPGVLVMLYENGYDSIPYLEKPDFVAKTDADGNYALQYLRPGKYKLFALKDGNQNYLYDSPDELIGFESEEVDVSEVQNNDLLVFNNYKEPKVLGYSVSPYRIAILMNKPIPLAQFNLQPAIDYSGSIVKKAGEQDSVIVYSDYKLNEPAEWIVKGFDKLIDTFKITIPTGQGPELVMNLRAKYAHGSEPILELTFSNPTLQSQRFDVVVISDDTSTATWNSMNDSFLMNGVPDKSYTIIVPNGIYTDLYGNVNTADTLTTRVRGVDNFSTIKMTLEVPDSTYMLQIGMLGEIPTHSSSIPEKWLESYSWLEPGRYYARIFNDSNGNEMWDTGNYLFGIQPEPMYYIKRDFSIRANWEFEIEWVLEE